MKIAVVGSGAAGLVAALGLSTQHTVTLYEKEKRLGGHAHTALLSIKGRQIPIDTGFIVYNTMNYPHLTALFRHLDIETEKTTMNFSVYGDGVFEWSSDNLTTILGNLRNIVNPRYLLMLKDVLKFNRVARDELNAGAIPDVTLGDYLDSRGFGQTFKRNYLMPMASAIWSSSPSTILAFPAKTFIRFFDNHRLLHRRRPPWRTVRGGSIRYVDKIAETMSADVRLETEVRTVRKTGNGWEIADGHGGLMPFDAVVMACHADTALGLIADPSDRQIKLLRAFEFRENKVVLHGDTNLLPKDRRLWTSWNCRSDCSRGDAEISVTYYMNRLQTIEGDDPFFVTLNPTLYPRQEYIYREYSYSHPQFDQAAIAAQGSLSGMQGADGLWFAGAYWGSGFHEDAVRSGVDVARALGCAPPWAPSAASA